MVQMCTKGGLYKTLCNTPTPTPTCVTEDVQIIACGKRQLLKSAKGLSDEYQCKFQFVF